MTNHENAVERCQLLPCGEAAFLVGLEGGERDWRLLDTAATAIRTAGYPWLVEANSTYGTLLVEFDPWLVEEETVADRVLDALKRSESRSDDVVRRFRMPVVYGAAAGPDTAFVADLLGMSVEALIAWHTSADWVVQVVGAPAGAPQCGGPDLAVPIPRLQTPRRRVPAGSVAMAGCSSHIYPLDAPGGWQLIGRTPVQILDLIDFRDPEYRPGDVFRFESIDDAEAESVAISLSGGLDDHR